MNSYIMKGRGDVSVAKILYRKTWYLQQSMTDRSKKDIDNVQERNIKGSSYNCMEDGETMLRHGSIKGLKLVNIA